MNYFIAYDSNSPATVWGSGSTENSAMEDAKIHIKQWIDITHTLTGEKVRAAKRFKLKVIKCDYSVLDYVNTYSGETVPWKVHNKVAHLDAINL